MRVGPGGAMVVSAAIVVRRARRMKEMCEGSRLFFFFGILPVCLEVLRGLVLGNGGMSCMMVDRCVSRLLVLR